MSFTAFGKEIMSPVARRIKCPVHYALKPGHLPFKTIPNPLFKKMNQVDLKRLGIRTWLKAKDSLGRPIINRDSYYQPEISANFAREKIYRADNPVCLTCKRCFIK